MWSSPLASTCKMAVKCIKELQRSSSISSRLFWVDWEPTWESLPLHFLWISMGFSLVGLKKGKIATCWPLDVLTLWSCYVLSVHFGCEVCGNRLSLLFWWSSLVFVCRHLDWLCSLFCDKKNLRPIVKILLNKLLNL